MLVTLLWLVLFASLVLWLAYTRASLAKATLVLGVLLVYYTLFGDGAPWWKATLWALFVPHFLLNIRPLAARPDLEPVPAGLQADAAAHVHDRARGARGRHGLVGRRTLHRRPGLAKAPVGEGAGAHGGRAGLHRRALRRTLPDDRRLGHHAPARGPSARSLRLHQEEGLLGDDHPQEVRRARVLRLRALDRRREDREPLEHGRLDRRRAELARAGGAPPALRHRGAEEALPAAARARRGDPLLRPHRPARRLGCGLDAGHRHRLPRPVPGPRDARHPPQFLEALHHARADRDDHRPRVPPVRPRKAHRRRQDRLRNHRRAGAARHARHHDRPPPLSAERPVPERADPGQGRVRAARRDHRRDEDGGPGLAHAGRAAVGRALHLVALDRDRRREGRRVLVRRLHAHPPPVQPAGRQVRGRRGRDRAHGRAHLHHGRGALGDDRRDRRRREALRARRHPQVPHHRVRPHGRRTTRWTCRAARASCSARRTTSAAPTRWFP